jgi:hypothetical protein
MTDFKLNILNNNNYKVIKPFNVIVNRESSHHLMTVEALDHCWGTGISWSRALQDLQISLIEDFEFLTENENCLGPHLKEILAIFREHLEMIPTTLSDA